MLPLLIFKSGTICGNYFLSQAHGAELTLFPRQFWFFPPVGQDMASAESSKPPKDGALSHLMRFELDPNSTEKTLKPRVLVDVDGELPRIDARYETKPYKYVFIAMHDPETDDAPVGGAFNSLAKANVEDGTYEYWSAGKDVALGEVAFVARSKDGESISRQCLSGAR